MTLSEIKAEVKRLDPKLDEKDDAFYAAVCLLSALEVGAYISTVVKFTGYSDSRVRRYARNLVASHVWCGGKTNADWGAKDGGIAFWCDVSVATGMLKRA